jgi:type II secretion system protein N
LLQSPDVTLAPAIASLLFGRPGLRVRARIYDGNVGATINRSGAAASVSFTFDSLNLAQVEPLRESGVELGGAMSGAGTAELVEDADPSRDTAHLALEGAGVTLKVISGLPPMRLGVVTGIAVLNDGTITMRDVEAHGDDVAIAARGTIRLAPEPADSIVDLTVSLTPTAAGRDRFAMLLNMLPHLPERGPYYISGPLTSPSVN